MEDYIEIAHKSNNISATLVKTLYLLDVLDILADGEGKTVTLLNLIKENIEYSFNEIETCRKILNSQ